MLNVIYYYYYIIINLPYAMHDATRLTDEVPDRRQTDMRYPCPINRYEVVGATFGVTFLSSDDEQ